MKNFLQLSFPLFLLACAVPVDGPPRGGAAAAFPWPAPERAPELGAVHWCRDLELAENEARREDRPILLVLQEVPG